MYHNIVNMNGGWGPGGPFQTTKFIQSDNLPNIDRFVHLVFYPNRINSQGRIFLGWTNLIERFFRVVNHYLMRKYIPENRDDAPL